MTVYKYLSISFRGSGDPNYSRVSAIDGTWQGNPFFHKNVRKLSGKFGSFLQCQGNLTLTMTAKNGAPYFNHHFSPLYCSLFCETFMDQ